MIKFLDLSAQYLSIKSEIDDVIQRVISESAFIGGQYVKSFETAFAEFCGTSHCVGVGNGTDALEIAIEALNLPIGSEILVPANSFIATAEAVTRQGHKVVFVDCELESYTICCDDVRAKITPNTKAIIAVHLYGHPCDMQVLCNIANEYDLKVVEDCAQAHGAIVQGRKVGSIGDIGTFSFYPGKNLGAYGDGGAIVTESSELALNCRKIANHGRIAKYDHDIEGRNSRLDALQAAVLTVKLKYLPRWTEARVAVADIYEKELTGLKEIHRPVRQPWAYQVYHLYVIRVRERNALKTWLEDLGIETGIHYPTALPKLAAYQYLAQASSTPLASKVDSSLLSLPIGEHITVDQARFVANAIKDFYK